MKYSKKKTSKRRRYRQRKRSRLSRTLKRQRGGTLTEAEDNIKQQEKAEIDRNYAEAIRAWELKWFAKEGWGGLETAIERRDSSLRNLHDASLAPSSRPTGRRGRNDGRFSTTATTEIQHGDSLGDLTAVMKKK